MAGRRAFVKGLACLVGIVGVRPALASAQVTTDRVELEQGELYVRPALRLVSVTTPGVVKLRHEPDHGRFVVTALHRGETTVTFTQADLSLLACTFTVRYHTPCAPRGE